MCVLFRSVLFYGLCSESAPGHGEPVRPGLASETSSCETRGGQLCSGCRVGRTEAVLSGPVPVLSARRRRGREKAETPRDGI